MIRHGGMQHCLGLFDDEGKAAEAYTPRLVVNPKLTWTFPWLGMHNAAVDRRRYGMLGQWFEAQKRQKPAAAKVWW